MKINLEKSLISGMWIASTVLNGQLIKARADTKKGARDLLKKLILK